MLRVIVKDLQAMEELKQGHGVKPYASLLATLRKVTKKLIHDDDTIEFVLSRSFFSDCYQKNPQAFCAHLHYGLGMKVIASKRLPGFITIRVGFELQAFEFAKNLTRELKKPTVWSVDAPVDSIPLAYQQQPFHFLNRLTKRIGIKISFLRLGEDWRFIKAKPKTKQ